MKGKKEKMEREENIKLLMRNLIFHYNAAKAAAVIVFYLIT
jgi:hypothetical protein